MHTWNHEPKGNLASKLSGTAGFQLLVQGRCNARPPIEDTPKQMDLPAVSNDATPHSTFPHASPYRIPMEKKAWQEGVMQGITGWWYTYPSEKWWSSSVSLFHSQYMESHKIPWFHHQPDFSIWEPVPKKNLLKCHPKGYQAAHHQCDIFHVQTPGGHICGHQCLAGALGEILVRWSHLWPLKKSVVFKKKRQILHDLMKQCQNTNGISVTKLNLGHLMVN